MLKAIKKKASLGAAVILLVFSLNFVTDLYNQLVDYVGGYSQISTLDDRPSKDNFDI